MLNATSKRSVLYNSHVAAITATCGLLNLPLHCACSDTVRVDAVRVVQVHHDYPMPTDITEYGITTSNSVPGAVRLLRVRAVELSCSAAALSPPLHCAANWTTLPLRPGILWGQADDQQLTFVFAYCRCADRQHSEPGAADVGAGVDQCVSAPRQCAAPQHLQGQSDDIQGACVCASKACSTCQKGCQFPTGRTPGFGCSRAPPRTLFQP